MLTSKIWVGSASFFSLSYINFGKIMLQISDLILKTDEVWDEITYPFLHVNGTTVEV